jgi:hypothetical protein
MDHVTARITREMLRIAMLGATAAVLAVVVGSCGAHPAAGEPYRLMTHCGIAWTNIAGTFWRAEHPLSDGHGNPPPGWGNPFQDGTLTLNGTTARFSSRAGTVMFQRTHRTRPPFLCS